MAKYGLDLQGENRKNKKRNRTLVIVFLCFAILLGTVSTLLMWRSYNYDFNNMFIKPDESTTAAPTTQISDITYTGSYEFLVAVTDETITQALFFNMICVDLSEKIIRVVPIDSNIADSGTGLSCEELLIKNGINATVLFLNKYYGIEIDRYALLTENGYKSFFRAMGDITVKVSRDIEYDTEDMFLELTRGENVLTPDKTYKYMKYLCETLEGYERSKANAEIVVAAFNAFCTTERFNSADNTFSIIIDYCESDISIVDFTNSKDELQYLIPASSKERLKVFVSDNIIVENAEVIEDEE